MLSYKDWMAWDTDRRWDLHVRGECRLKGFVGGSFYQLTTTGVSTSSVISKNTKSSGYSSRRRLSTDYIHRPHREKKNEVLFRWTPMFVPRLFNKTNCHDDVRWYHTNARVLPPGHCSLVDLKPFQMKMSHPWMADQQIINGSICCMICASLDHSRHTQRCI